MAKPTIWRVGPLRFQVAPVNLGEITEEGETAFARKGIYGGEQSFEHVGENDNAIKLSGHAWPDLFGGEAAIDAFDRARKAGTPMLAMRGGRTNRGWVICERFSASHKHLRADGVGKVIAVSMDLVKCGAPSGPAAIMAVMSLFRQL